MPLRRKRQDAPSDHGHFQALDQIGQWVRFADVKATILFASLGAVLTLVATSRADIVSALCVDSATKVMAALLFALAVAVLFTLSQLLWAVNPRSSTSGGGINRFAWPTLHKVSVKTLAKHAARTDPTTEVWAQVKDLADIAKKKFTATRRAAWGLGACLVLSIVLVAASVGVEAAHASQECASPIGHLNAASATTARRTASLPV